MTKLKDLKIKLEKVMEIYKDRFSNNSLNKKTSIFFGVTAAIFEALEKGIDVIHVCSDPVFESHSETIWPNLNVKQLSKFVFCYNLTLPGKYVIFGRADNTLNKIIKPLY